jgi:hypothetical protein
MGRTLQPPTDPRSLQCPVFWHSQTYHLGNWTLHRTQVGGGSRIPPHCAFKGVSAPLLQSDLKHSAVSRIQWFVGVIAMPVCKISWQVLHSINWQRHSGSHYTWSLFCPSPLIHIGDSVLPMSMLKKIKRDWKDRAQRCREVCMINRNY